MIVTRRKLFVGVVLTSLGCIACIACLKYGRTPLLWTNHFSRDSRMMRCSSSIYNLKFNEFNCSLLFKGDAEEIAKAKSIDNKSKWPVPSDDEFYKLADSCDWIKKELDRDYYVSEQERQFPLAFALSVYQSPYQIFRFLKVIYRPHNSYCIHYDKKSSEPFKKLMNTIAACLSNMIVPSKIADVIWGWHTIVDAQMNCMEDLYELRYKFPWKYAITLCGKEVPLRTNKEMVHTLRKLNGTSSVHVMENKKHEIKYWTYKFSLSGRSMVQLKEKLDPVPFNLTMAKSMAYYGLSETFVNYLLHNEEAVKFRRFMEDTRIADEHVVATLFNRTGVPGGRDERYVHLIPRTSSYLWLFSTTEKKLCTGWNVHNICIIANGDLQHLDYTFDPKKYHQTFFHNKFFIERDRAVMDCAEEELLRRNREECLSDNALSMH
ncbi:beta-1,3-galactosyl-O-glycosyl-glycoprotein beta-1,6-N-acetylglucosaminyltransferase 4-like [Halichondria panicea]|uniref:beta-1,3-galactosyl-O-glycosyl-glycoprotein beta-1,6-N-acetylglucosaminyltransferase 4-like n=1 Tax=Halichondria panicea TaxID=6063 RepID=UPI00312B40A9